MRRLVVIALALACALSAKTFTLEQVLSAPFPSEMTAAPGGGAVAWILNERGARNVWYAAAPDFKGVRLTSWTADDGQDLGRLHFTTDGKSLVFVRGDFTVGRTAIGAADGIWKILDAPVAVAGNAVEG